MAPPSDPPAAGGNAPAAGLAARLGADWRCLTDAVITAEGEEGRIDLVALHPRHGAVLVGFVAKSEEASPEAAADALRAMLREVGFAEYFPGHLGITALTALPEARFRLAVAIRRAVAEVRPTDLAPGWIDWLAERLVPPDRPPIPASAADDLPFLRLMAPRREEILPAAAPLALAAPPGAQPYAAPATHDGWRDWGVSVTLALVMLASLLLLLIGFAWSDSA